MHIFAIFIGRKLEFSVFHIHIPFCWLVFLISNVLSTPGWPINVHDYVFYLLFSHLLGWEHDDTSLRFWVLSFPTGPNVYWFVINHILYSQQRKQLIGPFCSEIMFLNSMESSPDCRLANRCGSEDREFSPQVYFILWWKQYLLQLSLFLGGALSSHKFMWLSTLGWEIISFFHLPWSNQLIAYFFTLSYNPTIYPW